ncbi:MAG TPA: divalent metal cation transporter [Vicinamibacterales bacterium]|jgi:NRAMP (natural resistance-associated macrophage protein)-like metal ion transporter|nr:divalent metal cation transporter [Vicinamibacterales bacterium]
MQPTTQVSSSSPEQRSFARFFGNLGPGLITGAADDDPSGISTYSVAGASFGYLPLWTALFSFPLMTAVQLMCARLGLVTGMGLAGIIRRRYSRWVLWSACLLLVIANAINIAADLGGMAEATRMVTGAPVAVCVPMYGVLIVSLLMWWSYRKIARVFKWLTLVLLAYVVTAFVSHVDWRLAMRATFIPHIEWSRSFFSVLVAILGTTISPYLFFWQAAQEVEEERAMGRTFARRRGATGEELTVCRTDVATGMFASNAIMYFIILTTAATLHAHGRNTIETAQQAAEALRPLAGAGAYWLFTLGLIGTGMLAVPVLAGSCAYAIAEAAAWRGSLDRQPRRAKKFYFVLAVAMAAGIGLNYAGFDAIRLLFTTAVINGILAPPLILIVLLLTSDRRVMGNAVNSPLMNVLGWTTFVVMVVAAIGLAFAS